MKLSLESLTKSIDVLRRSLNATEAHKDSFDEDMQDTLRSGIIQNFEVAYEQCWKMMKRWLEENVGIDDGLTKRELFRLAAEHQLILDVDNWMEYHEARNKTSHTYDEGTAEDVYEVAKAFLPSAEKFLNNIASHND